MSGSRSRSRRRRTALVGAAVACLLAVAATGPVGAQPSLGPLALDGHAWRGLSEGEKLALLTGFLLGGAFEQAAGLAPEPGAVAPETVEAMRRAGRFRFSYAPTVYKARLEDFYFYEDRLPTPLYRALFLINEEIRRGASGGR